MPFALRAALGAALSSPVASVKLERHGFPCLACRHALLWRVLGLWLTKGEVGVWPWGAEAGGSTCSLWFSGV